MRPLAFVTQRVTATLIATQVALAIRRTVGAQLLWCADYACRFDHSRLFWLVALIGRKQADLLDDFKARLICGPAENRILSVKGGLGSQANEELAAC